MEKIKNLITKIFLITTLVSLSCANAMEQNSDVAKIKYGVCSEQGHRPTMEDTHKIKICTDTECPYGFFGVFDGHGGPKVAKYLEENLLKNVLENYKSTLIEAIKKGFEQTNNEILKNEEIKWDGSTAIIAFIIGKQLIVANVGDSRAVINKNKVAIPLSTDHKPENLDEQKRIENAGGWVTNKRVCRSLATSRAFGDNIFKDYYKHIDCIKPIPDIKECTLSTMYDFLILACDGLWDVVSNEYALETVKYVIENSEKNTQKASQSLVRTALCKNSTDNITVIVVDLRDYVKTLENF